MTDEEREDLNTFRHDLVKQARWWQWKAETLEKENEQLKSENAALRARLENAIELPRIIHPNKNEWFIQYQLKSGIIDYNIRYSKEAAESRLAELKGEFHEITN